ncbi:hypothetical protein SH661x_003690 [Planctomicrobium sp. SH661]|uniref:hypothetical protein n=1 Tax=Planctomicrobium sp. SH661 TaxID=3448124 RepID=UPI003F5B1B67
MRARLFESDDDASHELLREVLEELGAIVEPPRTVLGVEVRSVRLQDQPLTLYLDAWNVEVEGPKAAVELILGTFRQSSE